MRLEPTDLTPAEQALPEEVRAFLAARPPPGSYPLGLGMSGDVDPQFSRDPGATASWQPPASVASTVGV